MWITFIILAFVIFADQITKYATELFIDKYETIEIIPHILTATKTYNKGAAWSMLSDSTWLLVIVSLVATVILAYFIFKNDWKKKKCYSIATTLMLGGTFGNLIDRFASVVYPEGREGVVDMIILEPLDALWEAITGSSFPIFNVADVALVVGIVFLAIDILFYQEKRAVK